MNSVLSSLISDGSTFSNLNVIRDETGICLRKDPVQILRCQIGENSMSAVNMLPA